MSDVRYSGTPGHFVGSAGCCYHLTTDIGGRYRVSTVGCYHGGSVAPIDRCWDNRVRLGAGAEDYYETMVFPIADGEITNWEGIDSERYATEGEADAGHADFVVEYTYKNRIEPAVPSCPDPVPSPSDDGGGE